MGMCKTPFEQLTHCALVLWAAVAFSCGGEANVGVAPESLSSESSIENGILIPFADEHTSGVVNYIWPGTTVGCTGVVMNAWWVLTVAHCLFDDNHHERFASSARHHTPTGSYEYFDIQEQFIHPDYDDEDPINGPDVALLLMSDMIPVHRSSGGVWVGFSRDLYRGALIWVEGVDIEIWGYGYYCEDETPDCWDGRLRRLDGTVEIGAPGGYFIYDPDDHLDGAMPVGGDSGGPWFVSKEFGDAPFDQEEKLVLAVHKGDYWLPFDHFEIGSPLYLATSWIDNKLAEGPFPLTPALIMAALHP